MSEYRYTLSITGSDPTQVSTMISVLKDEGIIPDILKPDIDPYRSADSVSYQVDLSTEHQQPYGTVRIWPAEEHEALFHKFSIAHPGLEFIFSGEDIDDPNNSVFKKAFKGGMFKEAYLEKQDIDYLLSLAPWRTFGAPEQEQGREEAVFNLIRKYIRLLPGCAIFVFLNHSCMKSTWMPSAICLNTVFPEVFLN